MWKPDVTVAAVVERDGRYLIVEERVRGRLVLNQPAGHLEPNESLTQAVIRETLEETGWHFIPAAVVGIYLWQQTPGPANARSKSFLRVAFCGDVASHEAARPLDKGIQRAVWLNQQQLLAQTARLRSPLVMRCIDEYLLGRRFPLDLIAHLGPDLQAGQGLALDQIAQKIS